ncbi:hypothetical protein ACE6H2_005109 [Prunus campanulata]
MAIRVTPPILFLLQHSQIQPPQPNLSSQHHTQTTTHPTKAERRIGEVTERRRDSDDELTRSNPFSTQGHPNPVRPSKSLQHTPLNFFSTPTAHAVGVAEGDSEGFC